MIFEVVWWHTKLYKDSKILDVSEKKKIFFNFWIFFFFSEAIFRVAAMFNWFKKKWPS